MWFPVNKLANDVMIPTNFKYSIEKLHCKIFTDGLIDRLERWDKLRTRGIEASGEGLSSGEEERDEVGEEHNQQQHDQPDQEQDRSYEAVQCNDSNPEHTARAEPVREKKKTKIRDIFKKYGSKFEQEVSRSIGIIKRVGKISMKRQQILLDCAHQLGALNVGHGTLIRRMGRNECATLKSEICTIGEEVESYPVMLERLVASKPLNYSSIDRPPEQCRGKAAWIGSSKRRERVLGPLTKLLPGAVSILNRDKHSEEDAIASNSRPKAPFARFGEPSTVAVNGGTWSSYLKVSHKPEYAMIRWCIFQHDSTVDGNGYIYCLKHEVKLPVRVRAQKQPRYFAALAPDAHQPPPIDVCSVNTNN
ncbi:hypothetical protein EJ08DRAFT_683335 [Tothia fuscella]|uniref:Uncharacterized protein n=1 Tax=Tothia fuscella TaxID=1048955 RepID=A0A9P4NGG1_9PEZI|nr:hypothetical protein EJ08DRAFT_683335 [Tothia fuscella]